MIILVQRLMLKGRYTAGNQLLFPNDAWHFLSVIMKVDNVFFSPQELICFLIIQTLKS